jgi:hypothetical protein
MSFAVLSRKNDPAAAKSKAPVLKLGIMSVSPGPTGGRTLGARIGAIGKGLKP